MRFSYRRKGRRWMQRIPPDTAIVPAAPNGYAPNAYADFAVGAIAEEDPKPRFHTEVPTPKCPREAARTVHVEAFHVEASTYGQTNESDTNTGGKP